MLVACFLISLLYVSGQCQNIIYLQQQENELNIIECVIGILNKYFTERKELTYVNMNSDDDAVLKAVHSTLNISLKYRQPTYQMFVANQAYLISSIDVNDFTEYFDYLLREPLWNPYARFLIVIRLIKDKELRLIFDELLKYHINNAVVINATDDLNLYTYNPFDNYACGRYYDNVINFGRCSQTTNELYPNKLVTGLKNCTFRASLTHRPPFTIDPSKTENKKTLLGTEEYIITLLGEEENFTVTFNYKDDSELYSTIASNMTVTGPMEMLQKNVCDVIFGGVMIVTNRAAAFTYLCGYHDYSDELRFAVKSASEVPIWRYIYLEFELDVWAYLLLVLVIFSILLIALLRTKDGTIVVLRLFDNLLLHGRAVETRLAVKYVLITWLWCAYLINTFYQTNLFSFTIHPSMEFRDLEEEDIKDFKPCFGNAIKKFLTSENTFFKYKTGNFGEEGCHTTAESLDTVSMTEETFTLVPNHFYLYNERKYNDKWGDPLIYYFDKPYTKFLYGYFFYKGFPITRSLKLNALRMRESGIADKSLHDQYYRRKLKQRFSQKKFETHFLFPWFICFPGGVIATVVFIMEILIKHRNRFICRFNFNHII